MEVTRIPAGHPEGYLEGFATLYREAADMISAEHTGAPRVLPGIAEGLEGVRFVAACIASSESGTAWIEF
jgi:hypothetical protein